MLQSVTVKKNNSHLFAQASIIWGGFNGDSSVVNDQLYELSAGDRIFKKASSFTNLEPGLGWTFFWGLSKWLRSGSLAAWWPPGSDSFYLAAGCPQDARVESCRSS